MFSLRIINYDRDDYIDLLNGRHLRIINQGWSYKPAIRGIIGTGLPYGAQATPGDYSPMTETFLVGGFGSDADVRLALGHLEDLFEQAQAWSDDPSEEQSVWLEWSTAGEALRRCLLFGGSWQLRSQQSSWPMLDRPSIVLSLAVLRHPLWEKIKSTVHGPTTVNSIGDTITFAGIPGRVPARIYGTTLKGVVGDGQLETLWFGIRPEYEGTASFDPVWECEEQLAPAGGDSDYDSLDMFDQGDGTCSNNWFAQCTFAVSAALTKRLSIIIRTVNGLVVPGCSHFFGEYAVLCRCSVSSAGTEAGIQVRSGWRNSRVEVSNETVLFDDLDWRIIELGNVTFPPTGAWHPDLLTTLDQMAAECEIEIWAERTAGTGNLQLDCLILIPTKHYLKVEDGWVYKDAVPTDNNVAVVTKENESVIGFARGVNTPFRSIIPAAVNWYVPEDNSIMVVAAEQAAASVITDDFTVELEYYPRWLAYENA